MNTRATHTALRPELARDLGRGYFDVGDFERHDHERRTRAVCERTRWLLFQGDRGGSSALGHSGRVDRRAVRARRRRAKQLIFIYFIEIGALRVDL